MVSSTLTIKARASPHLSAATAIKFSLKRLNVVAKAFLGLLCASACIPRGEHTHSHGIGTYLEPKRLCFIGPFDFVQTVLGAFWMSMRWGLSRYRPRSLRATSKEHLV